MAIVTLIASRWRILPPGALIFLMLCLVAVVGLGYYLFSFRKARLFGRMTGYVDLIQLSLYVKLWSQLEAKYGREAAKRLAAAVANKLLAKTPQHTDDEQRIAEKLAAGLLKEDDEVRYAALMSLRTMMVIESAKRDSAAMSRIMQTVEWMRQYWNMPLDPPNPDIMCELAAELTQKYLAQD